MAEFQVFMANHPMLFAMAAAIVFLLVLNEIKLATRGFKNVDPADAIRLINDGAEVIDLRSGDAYAKGHIINARNIELNKVLREPESVVQNGDHAIITCCETGVTSSRAATRLAMLAKDKVYNLKGGMAAWKRENLPITAKG